MSTFNSLQAANVGERNYKKTNTTSVTNSKSHSHSPLNHETFHLSIDCSFFSPCLSALSNFFNVICFLGRWGLFVLPSGGRIKPCITLCGCFVEQRLSSWEGEDERDLEDLYLIRDTVSRQGPVLTPSSAPRSQRADRTRWQTQTSTNIHVTLLAWTFSEKTQLICIWDW